jgi:hypothetical protein
MPSPERLEAFIARVVEGKHAEAIEEYYTETASMQENLNEPRRGRDTLVAQERKCWQARSRCAPPACGRCSSTATTW